MPKDASKNVDRYKVRGGHLNEYDFQKEKAADQRPMNTDKAPVKRGAAKKAVAPKTARKK